MMRVLLIWPHNEEAILGNALSCCEPLPLEYLAGALMPDHEVQIHDERLDPPLGSMASATPDLIGVAIPYTSMVRSSRRVASQARRMWPDVPIVIGGHHPTMSSEWLQGFPADYVIAGEGGHALRHLVECLERRTTVSPTPGLARFENGCARPRRSAIASLDELPPPNRGLLAKHQKRYFHSVYRPVALIRFSAGCPYRCSFCSLWRVTNRRYLTKANNRILQELQEISEENVYVVDDEAFIQSSRMDLLAQDIAEAGFRKRYHMYVRADTIVRSPSVISRWRLPGLIQFW